MRILANTEVRYRSVTGLVLSVIIFLLLSWQTSAQTVAAQSANSNIEQNLLATVDFNIEDNDFDFVIPLQNTRKHLLLFIGDEYRVVLSPYFHDLSLPQSRAPPNLR